MKQTALTSTVRLKNIMWNATRFTRTRRPAQISSNERYSRMVCTRSATQNSIDITLIYKAYRLIISQMEETNGQQTVTENEVKVRLHELEKIIAEVKTSSEARKTRRKEWVAKQKKDQTRRQSEHQQELSKLIVQHPPPKYRKESLGGLVIQVPQNSDLQSLPSNPYSPRSPLYYVSEVLKTYKNPRSVAREHLTTSLKILKNLENSKMCTNQQLKSQGKVLSLARKPGCIGKKTVVFDLDQTLIHCNQNLNQQYDLLITIPFPTGEQVEAGINVRPYAVELLEGLKGHFEVMIFTASHSCYANEILNKLDPTGQLIHHRLYRQHCHISQQGYFVKDLRILGRPLAEVLLIDNAAYSYAYQLDNGVPVLPYFQGKNDFELKALQTFLISLLQQPELRRPNRELFQLGRYLEFQGSVDRLVEQLYAP